MFDIEIYLWYHYSKTWKGELIMWDLKDKVAIVTGAASGIGLDTAKAFTDKGAKVVLSDYNEEGGKKVEKDFLDQGADVIFVAANVADESAVENLIAKTVNSYGRVDIIVNNAGVGVLAATHELTTQE